MKNCVVTYQEIHLLVIPTVMNEEAYEYRLRFFQANQLTGEDIFLDIVQVITRH